MPETQAAINPIGKAVCEAADDGGGHGGAVAALGSGMAWTGFHACTSSCESSSRIGSRRDAISRARRRWPPPDWTNTASRRVPVAVAMHTHTAGARRERASAGAVCARRSFWPFPRLLQPYGGIARPLRTHARREAPRAAFFTLYLDSGERQFPSSFPIIKSVSQSVSQSVSFKILTLLSAGGR